MIAPLTLARLKQAFERGDPSRMAAESAVCAPDTARRYRRALEASGAIAPTPVRKVKAGRMVHVEHIGEHQRTAARRPESDTRRMRFVMRTT